MSTGSRANRVLATAKYLLELDYDIWAYSDAESYGDRLVEMLATRGDTTIKKYWDDAKTAYYAENAE